MTDRAAPGSPGPPDSDARQPPAASAATDQFSNASAAAGSVPAELEQLVTEFSGPLYRYAFRLSGSAADAEDLTQQAFLVAHQKIDQLRDAQCVRGWLFTVLRNCYLKGRRGKLGLSVTDIDVNTLPAEPPVAPIDGRQLQEAINTLDDDFRVVVLMFYFEQLSYREIAEKLEIPLGTVMSRLARAKAHLRRRIQDDDQPLARVPRIEVPSAAHVFAHPTATRR